MIRLRDALKAMCEIYDTDGDHSYADGEAARELARKALRYPETEVEELQTAIAIQKQCIIDLERQLNNALQTPPTAKDGWVDISTAPKDGTEVLLLCKRGREKKPKVILHGFYIQEYEDWAETCRNDIITGTSITPVYWQPLPAAPVKDK